MKRLELEGKRFGRLTAIKYLGGSRWLCICDCGNTKDVLAGDLTKGATRSCGCIRREYVAQKNRDNATHNMTGTRIYHIWSGMKNRCYCEKTHCVERYKNRGITVCDEWRNSFEAFYAWAIANGYSDNLTIDRINNDGNYEPSNCRWATYKEQNNNKTFSFRKNVDFEKIQRLRDGGMTLDLACAECGITNATFYRRLHRKKYRKEN